MSSPARKMDCWGWPCIRGSPPMGGFSVTTARREFWRIACPASPCVETVSWIWLRSASSCGCPHASPSPIIREVGWPSTLRDAFTWALAITPTRTARKASLPWTIAPVRNSTILSAPLPILQTGGARFCASTRSPRAATRFRRATYFPRVIPRHCLRFTPWGAETRSA